MTFAENSPKSSISLSRWIAFRSKGATSLSLEVRAFECLAKALAYVDERNTFQSCCHPVTAADGPSYVFDRSSTWKKSRA